MTQQTDFFSHALHTIVYAVGRAAVEADLDRHPETIRKSVKRRCLSQLKRLAIIIRRLLFLMALQLELAPLKPCAGRNYFEAGKADAPKTHSFSLAPPPVGKCPDFLRGPQIVPHRGPVPAAPLIARVQAMLNALKHCERRAKGLARTLQRWQARGDSKPHILPIPKTHRLPAALALVSGALTARLIESLRNWPDTS